MRRLLLPSLLACFAMSLGCGGKKAEEATPDPAAAGPDAAKDAAAAAKAAAELRKPSKDPIPAPADVAAPPADALSTASGLKYKVLKPGTGTTHAAAEDSAEVHYTGWTTDGAMFDSSVQRGKPATFPLTRVIAGWTEGLQLMVEGESTRFWIPEDLAYKGRPGKPAGMLVFDVELIKITPAPEPPKTPEDVAAAPADATKTKSGLAIKFLEKGAKEGRLQPGPISLVQVHYSGWTTDGAMFDSSITRGRPAMFPLNRVIAGWTEGLQLMTEGDKVRLWVPEEMAYKGQPNKPQGMLVFDIELIRVMPTPKGGGSAVDASGKPLPGKAAAAPATAAKPTDASKPAPK